MTTAQFISKNFGVPSTKERHCSSVFADQDGNIYSYGYHYPVLFTIDGVAFRNNSGYSNSTSKHISWAGSYSTGVQSIDVWLDGCNQYSWRNSENAAKVPHLLYLQKYGKDAKLTRQLKKAILRDLQNEKADIQDRIDSKKRTNTAIYAALIEEMRGCVARLDQVQSAWGLK